MTKYSDSVAVVGRVLIGALFFISGLSKIAAPAATQDFIASVGLPFPVLAYATSVAVENLGVLLLVVRVQTRLMDAPIDVYACAKALGFHHAFADHNQVTDLL